MSGLERIKALLASEVVKLQEVRDDLADDTAMLTQYSTRVSNLKATEGDLLDSIARLKITAGVE